MVDDPQIRETAGGAAGPLSFEPLISALIGRLPANPGEWSLDARSGPKGQWLTVSHRHAAIPEQGWKLHISAATPSAHETLERALAVLLKQPVAFKVAASADALAVLNNGFATLSQIGKFITVYPRDDSHAVRLAVELAAATEGLKGPRIPSDRRLSPDGVVYYRFGSFGGLTLQTAAGEISFAVRNPDGILEPDIRDTVYRQPAWTIDPFVSAGVARDTASAPRLVGDRYLIAGVLHRSARGGVYLGVDLDRPRNCVLKHAEAGALIGADGRDARDQLRYEAAVLDRLASDLRFPAVLGLVEHEDDLYLAMDDLAGTTLESVVASYNARGCTIENAQVVTWGREILGMLAAVHAAGLVYGDLKSTNVIVAPDGRLRLIDFEHACEQHASERPPGRGTRGYMSFQQVSGAPADLTDDIYSFGALLAFMATGAEPSQAPRPTSLLDRPLELLRPLIDPVLAGVITRCLAVDPKLRFRTARDVEAALMAVQPRAGIAQSTVTAPSKSEAEARQRCRDLSRRVGDTLCRAAEPVGEGRGMGWTSNHPLGLGIRGRDVNTGAAGTLLVLAELVGEFEHSFHRDVLAQGARWLARAPAFGGEPLPGLYVGEAGVAAALLRTGQVLADSSLVEAAQARSHRLSGLPYTSPDLFNGSAGRLRLHLMVWDETHDPDDLACASAAGEHLLRTMAGVEDARSHWTIPAGFGPLSGQTYLGYAHGAAGIADALLDLFEVTADARLFEAACGTARWLQKLAVPALDDASGLCWPTTEGAEPVAAYWCHGAAGIGRFWLHAAALDVTPAAAGIAERAIATTARGVRWAGPTQCHGLAGAIEVLIDAYQANNDPTLLAKARVLEQLLLAFACEIDGQLAWPSESPTVITPDYNVGYAGVVSALLRLADPARRPHGLSRQGFRFDSKC